MGRSWRSFFTPSPFFSATSTSYYMTGQLTPGGHVVWTNLLSASFRFPCMVGGEEAEGGFCKDIECERMCLPAWRIC